jgi:hypothetical protein
MSKRKTTQPQRTTAKSKPADILNDVLASGGSISFHCGKCTRKFVGTNQIHEEGFWSAVDGAGNSLEIPYKLTAVMGEPVKAGAAVEPGLHTARLDSKSIVR